MFTGLIQEVGTVKTVSPMLGGGLTVVVQAPHSVPKLTPGASIALNGCCTTAIAFDTETFTVELSPETLACTTFAHLAPNDRLNVELPLLATSPLGGHYVSGHVDGCVTLRDKQPVGEYWELRLSLPVQPAQHAWFIPKGSVALNGISLTVNTVEADAFTVCIIPHTMANTTLSDAAIGEALHFEGDILGKYVQRFLSLQQA
jgi:riboflavin synthase